MTHSVLAAVLAGAGNVNWTLLGVAGAILVGGAVALLIHFRNVKRRETIEALRSRRSSQPDATIRVPRDNTSSRSHRQNYDEAVSKGDHQAAALWAKKMHDPRLYAQAVEKSGDVERAVNAWVDLKEYHRAAKLLEGAGQPGKAARLYEEVGSQKKAIDSFIQADDPASAARLLRQTGDERRANLLDGDARARKGEHMEAARFYVAGNDMLKAAQELIKAGDMPKAIEALRRGGKADQAAEILQQQGEYAPAAKLFEEASKWEQAADCYEKLEDTEAQARCLASAGLGYRAGRIAFEKGDFDRALGYFEAIGPLDKHYADAGLFRGQIYERRGQLQEGADAYGTFLKDRAPDTKNKVLFMRVAQIQEGIGRVRAALSILGRIITSGMGTPDVTSWAARLERQTMDDFETEAIESKQPTMAKAKIDGIAAAKEERRASMTQAGRSGWEALT